MNPAEVPWRDIESAPKNGDVIEVMNGLMKWPVDAWWGEHIACINGMYLTPRMMWLTYHGQFVIPTHWRPKTTEDQLSVRRFEPLVEFPPLPAEETA